MKVFYHIKLLNFCNQKIYFNKQLEDQFRKDIKSNTFELTINGQTIIPNKHFEEYNNIKNKVPSHNIAERFLYHGTRLVNHQKIINSHFLMPGEDEQLWEKLKVILLDCGFYGKKGTI